MLRRLSKRDSQAAAAVLSVVDQLSEDAFQPSLGTHKLKGHLNGYWSAKAGYDLRILFEFVPFEDQEEILLHTVGTHDEVY